MLGSGTLLTILSKTADSYRIATDVESIIATRGYEEVFKIALLVVCASLVDRTDDW